MVTTIACVLRSGGEFNISHVSRLYDLVSAHIPEFCWRPVLDSPWPGWWSKISLFEPGRFTGRCLYMDLDCTPCGPLADLAAVDASFVSIRDWWQKHTLNSSVMAWDAGACDHIWRAFVTDPEGVMARFRGDQDFITFCMPGAATFLPSWVPSYKATVLRWNVLPPAARVVVHHGVPRPWSLPADYLERYRVG